MVGDAQIICSYGPRANKYEHFPMRGTKEKNPRRRRLIKKKRLSRDRLMHSTGRVGKAPELEEVSGLLDKSKQDIIGEVTKVMTEKSTAIMNAEEAEKPVSNEMQEIGTSDINADGSIKLSAGKKRHVLVLAG